VIFACLVAPVWARHDVSACGTTRETPNETLFLHRQAVRARAARLLKPMAAATASANRDIGNIAVIEDTGGVVERLNQFDLDNNTLTFTPAAPNAAQYSYSVARRATIPARPLKARRWPPWMTTTPAWSACPSPSRFSAPPITRCSSTPMATSPLRWATSLPPTVPWAA
jgi:hypothetical protein